MRRLVIILAALLWSLPALAAPSEIIIFFPMDDVLRLHVSDYVTDSVDVLTDSANSTTTTNIDALAALGTRMDLMISNPVCSPTRAEIMTGRRIHRAENLYGRIRNARTPAFEVEVNPNAFHLPRAMKAAGYDTAFFGKNHMSTPYWNRGIPGSFLHNIGFDYVGAVMAANGVSADPLRVGDGHPNELTQREQDCLGNECTVYTDNDGNSEYVCTYSTDYIVGELKAYIGTWRADHPTDGKLFIWAATTAPHGPRCPAIGTASWDCPATCGSTGLTTQDDRPPGGVGTTNAEVYKEMVEDLDDQVGDVVALLDFDNDIIIVASDNGIPAEVGNPSDCTDSKGVKGSEWPCGTFVPTIFRGKGISAGVMTDLHHVTDLTTTIIQLAGGTRYPSSDGVGFADCLTSSNGQSPATCTLNAPVVTEARWSPLGGSTGSLQKPCAENDEADEFDECLYTAWAQPAGGVIPFLRRTYNPSSTTGQFCEEFYEISLTVDRYVDDATGADDSTACPNGGKVGSTTTTDLLHTYLDDMRAREGRSIPRLSGGSIRGGG